TECFSRKIVSLGEENPRIACITAAMSKGTGLDAFSRRFPERFFDAGIAEEHAVTFAGGLAAGGMIPVTAIYSTFIQRSVDQIIEDIALQKRHAVFVFDRAGAVPDDGETHQGIFDISLFKCVPNLVLMTAGTARDLELCLDYAVSGTESPVCIRWSKNTCPTETEPFTREVQEGRGVFVNSQDFAASLSPKEDELSLPHKKILLCCTGSLYPETLTAARSLLMEKTECDIFSLRFIKPFDYSYFEEIAEKYDALLLAEDGVKKGGFGEEWLISVKKKFPEKKVSVLGFPDAFPANGTRAEILAASGLDSAGIAASARALLEE
ncbi:MAG: 1-deoxy-D-xylulose-5-phosphate synthase, partial [Treponema sp.]|nr:1-deoxy-D-xylulose-5-phosphate synthase [Treponema sp.]